MFKLAHLSDPHLGPMPRVALRDLASKRVLGYANWHRSRHRLHREEVLDAVISHMLAQHPDHIAVTGDLINIALPLEFQAAQAWLATLGTPEDVSVVPGNHDAYVRTRFEDTLALWDAYMRSDPDVDPKIRPFPFVRRRGSVSLIGISTGFPAPLFKAVGRLGHRQIARFEAVLKAERAAGQCRVVLMHHPPHADGTKARKRLIDSGPFLEALKSAGADLVVYGHNHRFDVSWLEGPQHMIPAVAAPSASAAVTDTGDEGGYHVFEIDAQGGHAEIVVTRYGAGIDRAIVQIGEPIRLNTEDQDTVAALLKASASRVGLI